MKRLFIILFISGALMAVFIFYKRQRTASGLNVQDPATLDYEGQVAYVINIIRNNPAWLNHVQVMATNGHNWEGPGSQKGEPPMTLQGRLVLEATHHLQKRGITDIINNPDKFLGY